MNFTELEKKLPELRQTFELKFKYFSSRGLSRNAVLCIEQGENYKIDSFFKYLEILNYCLVVNGTPVLDKEAFGSVLTELRQQQGLSQMDISSGKEIWPYQVVAIEKGRSYKKSSLLHYLKALNTDFEVKSLIDVL